MRAAAAVSWSGMITDHPPICDWNIKNIVFPGVCSEHQAALSNSQAADIRETDPPWFIFLPRRVLCNNDDPLSKDKPYPNFTELQLRHHNKKTNLYEVNVWFLWICKIIMKTVK